MKKDEMCVEKREHLTKQPGGGVNLISLLNIKKNEVGKWSMFQLLFLYIM